MSTGAQPRIVVGVDGSDHSVAALRWALEHARQLDWRVEAVLAWQLPTIGVPGAFDRDEMQRLASDQLVSTVSSVTRTPAVPLGTSVAQGDPIESLLAAAQDAALLVVGTRGRTPFKGLVLGSVSQACAAYAACPVVIVKAARDSRTIQAASAAATTASTPDTR